MAQPDHKRGDAPGRDTEGDAQSKISGQPIKGHRTPASKRPDSGAVMDCMAACTGRLDCPWSCVLIGGART